MFAKENKKIRAQVFPSLFFFSGKTISPTKIRFLDGTLPDSRKCLQGFEMDIKKKRSSEIVPTSSKQNPEQQDMNSKEMESDVDKNSEVTDEPQRLQIMKRSRMGKSFQMGVVRPRNNSLDEQDQTGESNNNDDDSPRFSAFSSALPPIPVMDDGPETQFALSDTQNMSSRTSGDSIKGLEESTREKSKHGSTSKTNDEEGTQNTGNERPNDSQPKRNGLSHNGPSHQPPKRKRIKREAIFIAQVNIPEPKFANDKNTPTNNDEDTSSENFFRNESADIDDFGEISGNAAPLPPGKDVSESSRLGGEEEEDSKFGGEERKFGGSGSGATGSKFGSKFGSSSTDLKSFGSNMKSFGSNNDLKSFGSNNDLKSMNDDQRSEKNSELTRASATTSLMHRTNSMMLPRHDTHTDRLTSSATDVPSAADVADTFFANDLGGGSLGGSDHTTTHHLENANTTDNTLPLNTLPHNTLNNTNHAEQNNATSPASSMMNAAISPTSKSAFVQTPTILHQLMSPDKCTNMGFATPPCDDIFANMGK